MFFAHPDGRVGDSADSMKEVFLMVFKLVPKNNRGKFSSPQAGEITWGTGFPQFEFRNSWPCLALCSESFSRLIPLRMGGLGWVIVREIRLEKFAWLARQGKAEREVICNEDSSKRY